MTEDRTHLLVWLKQRFRDRRPVNIISYHGYGTVEQVRIVGRVLRDPGIPPPEANDSAWENLLASYEQLESDEIAGLSVQGDLAGTLVEAIRDVEANSDNIACEVVSLFGSATLLSIRSYRSGYR